MLPLACRYAAACQAQRRLEALQEDWQRQHSAFLASAWQTLQQAESATLDAAEAAASRLSNAVEQMLLQDQLEGIGVVRREQQDRREAQAAADAAAEAAVAATAEAARRQRTAEQKEQVAEYRQHLCQQQAEADAHAHEQQQAAEAAAAAAIAASKPAVEARQAEALKQLQQQQDMQRQRQAAALAQQQRLAAIADALAPRLPRDPQRVLQATAASSAAAPVTDPAFKPVHGFTAQQVVADPRFRFVEAMSGAGILQGAAGRAGVIKEAMARLQAGSTAGRQAGSTAKPDRLAT